MKHIFHKSLIGSLLILMGSAWHPLHAQIEHGGEPYGKSLPEATFLELAAPDLKSYRDEDRVNDLDKSIPYRFGANLETSISSLTDGEWIELENGDGLWRLGIRAEGASSLNFLFDVYEPSANGELYVYRPDLTQVKGHFNRSNQSPSGSLGVGLIRGDELIIEYREPAAERGQGYFHIDLVTYGYRGVDHIIQEVKSAAGPFGNAGPCNIDVNCPEYAMYDHQKRSVALIVVNNNGLCSGALVNNTSQDLHPYFITANHCLPFNTSGVSNWVFYFNHESFECGLNDGPIDQSISGATLLANSAESDFALLELNNSVPASFNACFSGWDATDNQASVQSAYGIHHPRGDVKKICFEEDAPYHASLGIFVNQTWYIDEWELGVTEPTSSGSPLFDQNGNMIGVLAGGAAACNGPVNNGLHDFYGRIGVAWDFGTSLSNRLKDWLDPLNSGVLVLGNSCGAVAVENTLSLGSIQGIESIYCGLQSLAPSISVVNTGTNSIQAFTYEFLLNGSSLGSFEETVNIPVSGSVQINLPDFTPAAGSNNISVQLLSVNGSTDVSGPGSSSQTNFFASANPEVFTLEIIFDDYPEETTWELQSDDGLVLYSGGPYDGQATLSQPMCLEANACYTLFIYDSFGDGICCGYGEGSYTLLDPWGGVVASGGAFESVASHSFCGSLLNTSVHQANNGMKVFPNPSNGDFSLETLDGFDADLLISLFDMQGKLLWQERPGALPTGAQRLIPAQSLAPGVYLLRASDGSGRYSRKVLIQR